MNVCIWCCFPLDPFIPTHPSIHTMLLQQVNERLWQIPAAHGPETSDFVNHSCEANSGAFAILLFYTLTGDRGRVLVCVDGGVCGWMDGWVYNLATPPPNNHRHQHDDNGRDGGLHDGGGAAGHRGGGGGACCCRVLSFLLGGRGLCVDSRSVRAFHLVCTLPMFAFTQPRQVTIDYGTVNSGANTSAADNFTCRCVCLIVCSFPCPPPCSCDAWDGTCGGDGRRPLFLNIPAPIYKHPFPTQGAKRPPAAGR